LEATTTLGIETSGASLSADIVVAALISIAAINSPFFSLALFSIWRLSARVRKSPTLILEKSGLSAIKIIRIQKNLMQ
jgi:hypothetical protein